MDTTTSTGPQQRRHDMANNQHARTVPPMQLLRNDRRRRLRARRGVVMLEFVMMFPAFLFVLLFTVDMGRMVLLQAGLQDATQQSARSGAQVGGGHIGISGGNISRVTFEEAIRRAPGMERGRIASFNVSSGRRCTSANSNVIVTGTYRANFITPGLTSLLGILAGDNRGPEGDWTLRATSVARCEVIRP